jgi:hypothetical protein
MVEKMVGRVQHIRPKGECPWGRWGVGGIVDVGLHCGLVGPVKLHLETAIEFSPVIGERKEYRTEAELGTQGFCQTEPTRTTYPPLFDFATTPPHGFDLSLLDNWDRVHDMANLSLASRDNPV